MLSHAQYRQQIIHKSRVNRQAKQAAARAVGLYYGAVECPAAEESLIVDTQENGVIKERRVPVEYVFTANRDALL